MTAASAYLLSVLKRGSVSWPNDSHTPDWTDRPRPRKKYEPHFPVSFELLTAPDESDVLTLLETATSAYGYQNRRLDVSPNDRDGRAFRIAEPIYGRAAAAGGGLYPIELYLRTSGTTNLVAGTYYIDWALRRLAPISLGIRPQPDGLGNAHNHDIVVTVRYWANAFKYGDFTYHVVAMDVGAFLATFGIALPAAVKDACEIQLVAGNDPIRNSLGISHPDEDVYATISIGSSSDLSRRLSSRHPGRAHAEERSKAPQTFPQTARVLTEHVANCELARTWALPSVRLRDPVTALSSRHTSFGRFVSRGVDVNTLNDIVRETLTVSSVIAQSLEMPQLEMYAVVLNVEGLAAGVHRFDQAAECWVSTKEIMNSYELQTAYFLDNYDMAKVAVVLIPVAIPEAARDVRGNGYRALNAQVGAVAQLVYLLSADNSVGCGAMLGFDNAAVGRSVLGSEPANLSDEWPFLLLALGHEVNPLHRFHATLKTIEER